MELKQTYQLTNSQRERERESKLQLPEAKNPSSEKPKEEKPRKFMLFFHRKEIIKKKPNRTKTGHPQKETETHLTSADTVTTT
jgi:hypothetical protein